MAHKAPCWSGGADDDGANRQTLGVEAARLRQHRRPIETWTVGNESDLEGPKIRGDSLDAW
jgi:hypothetical protein